VTSSSCPPSVVAEARPAAWSCLPRRASFGGGGRSWSGGLLVLWLATLGLAGCGHAPARTGLVAPPAAPYQDNLLAAEIAASMIGTPYRAGGDRPREGFDCSGLVRYSYRLLGLDLPRTADAQRAADRAGGRRRAGHRRPAVFPYQWRHQPVWASITATASSCTRPRAARRSCAVGSMSPTGGRDWTRVVDRCRGLRTVPAAARAAVPGH